MKVFVNGNVITVNDNLPKATAVAFDNGVIAAVGADEAVLQSARGGAEVVDLAGKTLLPGFIDAHSHYGMAAFRYLTEVDLTGPPVGEITTIDAAVEKLRAYADENRPVIMGYGFDDTLVAEKRRLTTADLDRVSTQKPVIVSHASGHIHFLNTRALARLGINEHSPQPSDGVYCKDAAGRLTGTVEEALGGIKRAFGRDEYTPAEYQKALALIGAKYAGAGVTTASSGSTGSAAELELYKMGLENGLLKNRVVLNRLIEPIPQFDSFPYGEMVMRGTLKTFYDGSIQCHTGYLSQPYYRQLKGAPPDFRGYPVTTLDQLTAVVKKYHDQGEQLLIHGNGDQAITDILTAFECAQRDNPRPDPRHVVIHAQMAREDNLDKMKELGVIPSFFSLHTYYWGDRHAAIFIGPERAARISPARSALKRGVVFTTHCDTPVTPQLPLLAIWSAVNRRSFQGNTIGAGQCIDAYNAVKAYTWNAAYQYKLEDKAGSIEPGKWADFVILSEDPLSCDPMRIKDIEVLETIVGGKTVYKR